MKHDAKEFSAKLAELTSELSALDAELKDGQEVEGRSLRELRHALDNLRMTAWTVNELLDAQHVKRDPKGVLSFLAEERVRRFSQMITDLCEDLERDGSTMHTHALRGLEESLQQLQDRLALLARSRPHEIGLKKRVGGRPERDE